MDGFKLPIYTYGGWKELCDALQISYSNYQRATRSKTHQAPQDQINYKIHQVMKEQKRTKDIFSCKFLQ